MNPSTKKNAVNIYVINQTATQYSPVLQEFYGKSLGSTPLGIPGNDSKTLIASFEGNGGKGPCGYIKYGLTGETQMYFYFNNPEGDEALGDCKALKCQWFYVYLQPANGSSESSGSSGKGTTYYVDISGFTPNTMGGSDSDVLNPVVTIYKDS